MARARSVWRCADCGHDHPKWVGRCEACGAWNSVAEEPVAANPARGGGAIPTGAPVVRLRDIASVRLERWSTGMPELDFVLGGGLVPGSMTLIGGEPGIGKSTLLLQAAGRLEAQGRSVLYASGEESAEQLRLRADRLGEEAGRVQVIGETRLEAVMQAARVVDASVLILDSIQTVFTDSLESAPGNVGQVRECAGHLMRFAKATGIAVIVVGHVTKGGSIAGPKTLEHIVDTVLYFEGEASLDYRLLRATKNRFGPIDELGVFSMTEGGLVPVANPSAVFLAARAAGTSGSAVTALMEGTRPVLVEVQALASPSGYGTPQRVATGLDPRRLAVILAVLERRAGTSFANLDVFVQVTAGVRLTEPGADLAVAAALLSSMHDRAAPADALFLGELGLGGEVRPIGGVERRLAEAARLGFLQAFGSSRTSVDVPGIRHRGLEHVHELVRALAARDVGVVVVAAGESVRFGGEVPKQYLDLAGAPVLLHALRPFASHPDVAQIVVVLREEDAKAPPSWLAPLAGAALTTVPGGATRRDSVAAGLAALDPACQVVLIHDGARPFPPRGVIDAGIAAARTGRSAVPALPVADTVKRAGPYGRVRATIPRDGLWLAQTPQAFPREVLRRAHAMGAGGDTPITDDAMLVELLGEPVDIIPGAPGNIKITTSHDLALAAWLIAHP